MTTKEKLEILRHNMASAGIDAYIIPSSDLHMSEYLPEHWKIMEWLTGFSGSSGTVVITRDFAGVWTDSRYFLQAGIQLKDSGFTLVRLMIPHTPEYLGWLAGILPENSCIGYDGKIVSLSLGRRINEMARNRGFSVLANSDLVSAVWKDRPPLPGTRVFLHEKKYTGLSAAEKMEKIRLIMKKEDTDALLVTALDDIAWLFNIRAGDIQYNPVAIAFAIVFADEARLFINPEQTDEGTVKYLKHEGIDLYPYEAWWEHLSGLKEGTDIWCSPASTSILTRELLNKRYRVHESASPVAMEKAIKNPVEISNIRETMILDGIALEKFFFWLEQNLGKQRITEISAAEKLENFRKENPHYHGPSFATIAACGAHGAVIHYSPSPESDTELEPGSLFLLDSGGQYLTGTTDVTRTIPLGKPAKEQIIDFTLVLKGMISLSALRFPEGTKGCQMDILARQYLWQKGFNYGHGTGHGVGYFLNVHEGPQSVGTGSSGAQETSISPGMILSDEPGIYHDNEYGIRTENLILCVPDAETPFGRFRTFETLTLCHIEKQLINPDLLLPAEKEWLNQYHRRVYEKLSPGLSEAERAWLQAKTDPMA